MNAVAGILIKLPILLFSVIVHEVAHGWVAERCGDPTARLAGRITLNPLPHIDPFMSIVLPALLLLSRSGIIFGGARPVPVNPYYFRRPGRDEVLVSLAGITANVALALVFVVLARVLVAAGWALDAAGRMTLPMYVCVMGVAINAMLAAFNLLPIPPLDGSHVLEKVLPWEWRERYMALRSFGPLVLILVLFLFGGLVGAYIGSVTDIFLRLIA